MRPFKKRAGPKSSKLPAKKPMKKVAPIADLGDTDTDSSSLITESFRSPPPDENVTDYQLEFTSVDYSPQRPTRKSPRRLERLPSSPEAASTSRNISITRAAVTNTARRHTTTRISTAASTSQHARNQLPPQRHHRRKQTFPKRKEWRKLLMSTEFMIPRLPFGRVVREIMMQQSREVCMITRDALEALQTAAEKYLENRFEDSYLVAIHSRRKTLMVRDMELVNYLLSRFSVC